MIIRSEKTEILTPGKLFQEEILSIQDKDGHRLPEINPDKTDQKAIVKLGVDTTRIHLSVNGYSKLPGRIISEY